MATAGKSSDQGPARPKAKPSKARPRRERIVEASRGDVGESGEAQESPRPTIRELAIKFLKHPDEWLDHPHPQFGGRTPNEMIASGHEDKVRNLFEGYEFGLF